MQTVIVMPFTDTRLVKSANAFTDPRVTDMNDAVWLCLLICACGARLKLPAALFLANRGKQEAQLVAQI